MGFREYVNNVKKRDPAFKSVIEILLYPSFYAVGFHRVAHFFYRHHLFFAARLISQFSRFLTGIEIHPGAKIGRRFFIDHGCGVVIGETCEIGDDVLLYQGVTLGGTGKDIGKRHPTIGNNVMIGAGVKVLGPFKVGDNARIGAGSVVLSEVPPNATVVGIPGRVITPKVTQPYMDQVHFPDPVSMELCRLRHRIEELEKRLGDKNHEDI